MRGVLPLPSIADMEVRLPPGEFSLSTLESDIIRMRNLYLTAVLAADNINQSPQEEFTAGKAIAAAQTASTLGVQYQRALDELTNHITKQIVNLSAAALNKERLVRLRSQNQPSSTYPVRHAQ